MVYVPVPSSTNQNNYIVIGVFAAVIVVLFAVLGVVLVRRNNKKPEDKKKVPSMRSVIVMGDFNEYITTHNPLVRRPSGILTGNTRTEFEPMRPRYSV